ncbi:MAG TPA: transglycosylase SLT domain-containing protein [Stellaceae bacterium]|nr:transglycosylase SLT domain-containing protein [Stellaceae bacterium]
MAVPSNPYPALTRAVDPQLVRTIRQASLASSSDFGLLMAQAQQESSFNPAAKAATGSASGLYQFVDSTWLDMVRRFGAKYGASQLASQIGTDAAGKPTVADPAAKQHILALRNDPNLATALAGEYAKLNKGELESALGRPATRADLYMAHFLGPSGATSFLKALHTEGGSSAAQLLPDAAANNPGIFYDTAGHARSISAIYSMLGGRIEAAANGFATNAPPSAGIASADVSDATLAAFTPGGAGASLPINFAGVTLTPPVASMLDALTLAALKLISGTAGGPASPHGTNAG